MGFQSTTNIAVRFVRRPIVALARWVGRHYPELLVRIRYFARFHKRLHLKHPRTLNEKILYLSLRTDTSEWSRLADKYEVRKFVQERGAEQALIPTYALFDTAEAIDFAILPKSFVMKTTHGSGDVLIVKDWDNIDIQSVKDYFAQMMKHRYGELEGGKHYMKIKPRVIVEALMENDRESAKYSSSIIDYKFWCFNGEPRYCWVCCNRDKHGTDVMTYDMDWQAHPEWSVWSRHYRQGHVIPRPVRFDDMRDLCRSLSGEFPCVRVDLYHIDNKVYFGELTFTSLGGLMNYFTPEFLDMAGAQLQLPED